METAISTCPTCGCQGVRWRCVEDCRLLRCPSCGLVFGTGAGVNVGRAFWSADALQTTEEGLDHNFQGFSSANAYRDYRQVFEGFFAERLAALQRWGKVASLLDVGAGPGFFVHYAAARLPEVLGLDLNGENVRYAQQALHAPVRLGDAESLRGTEFDRLWDAITCCEMLYYLDEPLAFLRQCRAMLPAGGLLYVQVPNNVDYHWACGVAEDFRWAHAQWHFSRRSLGAMLRAASFQVVEVRTGVNGVVPEYQKGGPSPWRRAQWALARALRVGGRLQVVARGL